MSDKTNKRANQRQQGFLLEESMADGDKSNDRGVKNISSGLRRKVFCNRYIIMNNCDSIGTLICVQNGNGLLPIIGEEMLIYVMTQPLA